MHQNKGEHIALFLSRIHPKKGLLTLVEAWAMARPEGWRAVVAGPDDGGHRARVVSAVNSAGLTEVFSFLDEVEGEQKAALLQRSSLFVLPSFSENFGVAVAEALGAGVPVITTTATPWEGLEWHRCGWWVDPDAESLAGALREATDLSNDSRREMGERGREFVSREFGWLGVGRRMREAYEWILRGGATPSFIHAE
jgi:glycosyltransferase involved in cell wall biosynthesis